MRFVPNFKILGQVVPEKSLTKISIPWVFIILEREKENVKKIEKECKNKSQHIGFVFSNTVSHPYPVYKI